MGDFIYDNFGWITAVLCGLMIISFVSIAQNQVSARKAFMAECLQDNKQYQCDVLWGQTDESKQVRDAAIGMAAGAAIGAAASRR